MKSNILTITLNPSVDKSSRVDAIIPEKKLKCDKPKYEPGGGGINVSRALQRLGTISDALFTSGGNNGRRLEKLLTAERISSLPFKVEDETRENVIIDDARTNEQFRFGFPGQQLSDEERYALLAEFKIILPQYDLVVISGSLPQESDTPLLIAMIECCRSMDKKVVLDSSGQALQAGLEMGVYMIKPNIAELTSLVGMDTIDERKMDEAASRLIDAEKTSLIVVSLGGEGAVLYSSERKVFLKAPLVEVRSTVGAGDSMVAGMVGLSLNRRRLKGRSKDGDSLRISNDDGRGYRSLQVGRCRGTASRD